MVIGGMSTLIAIAIGIFLRVSSKSPIEKATEKFIEEFVGEPLADDVMGDIGLLPRSGETHYFIYYVAIDSTETRFGPSPNENVAHTFLEGAKLESTRRSGEWVFVTDDDKGGVGWVLLSSLSREPQ